MSDVLKTLSNDQKLALQKLAAWLQDKDRKSYITLGGYAGTGKTTLISVLRTLLNKSNPKLKVAFCAFTGKASMVLKKKLEASQSIFDQDFIGTIHSLIYNPILNDQQEIVGWRLEEKLSYNLLIVDEASMIDSKIWSDLLSFGIPIIAVGDHGQLPPINSSYELMKDPEIRLEKIHRQAENNPIIKLSTMVRKNGKIPVGHYGDGVVKFSNKDPESAQVLEELIESYDKNTLILCGYNSTRNKLNQWVRNKQGIEEQRPISGDRVICLKNNHEKNIFNGMLGTLETCIEKKGDMFDVEILLDDFIKPYSGLISQKQFGHPTALNFSEYRKLLLKADLFDFGYALTVHKAQGSQAKRVIILEERFKQMTDEEWRRWLYTAVTRAEIELYIFGD